MSLPLSPELRFDSAGAHSRSHAVDRDPDTPSWSTWEKGLAMPWTVKYEVLRLLAYPFVRLRLAWSGVDWGNGWRVFGSPVVQRCQGSEIRIGAGAELRSWKGSNPLMPHRPVVFATRSPSAVIRVGDRVKLTGTVIVAMSEIEIGDDVWIGANVTIADTDFHPVRSTARSQAPLAGAARPVRIDDEAFIGMNAIILKGVTVGARSGVGAGSVVSTDVPPDTVVAGNPAQVVRKI